MIGWILAAVLWIVIGSPALALLVGGCIALRDKEKPIEVPDDVSSLTP